MSTEISLCYCCFSEDEYVHTWRAFTAFIVQLFMTFAQGFQDGSPLLREIPALEYIYVDVM